MKHTRPVTVRRAQVDEDEAQERFLTTTIFRAIVALVAVVSRKTGFPI